MSLADLINLAATGVPGLDAGLTILTATYTTIENVKIYRQQCRDMSSRCVSLMLALREGSEGLEGHKDIELADEITAVVERINKKVVEWANLSRVRSFLQQREIKDGIDRLHREIDAAVARFNIQHNMHSARGYIETRAVQDRDKAEIRELLENIIKSQDDMRALLNMQSEASRPVEEIMESLQIELQNPSINQDQEQSFRAGLWSLHQQTSRLPPLEDLTGQITMHPDRKHTVAKGMFNDIYLGTWLGQEQVALRLPRALANNQDVQRRFQREVAIWRSLKHDNVVPLYGIVYFDEDVYSVSPWMDNGTSLEYCKRSIEVDRLRILTEVAFGLQYLHANMIVHGDLRCANVLINKKGTARLSDFGLSKFLEDCGKGMTSSPGTNPRWFAPELLLNSGSPSTHSDVWSFGMLALELMTGEQPYHEISRDISVMNELNRGKIPERPGRLVTAQGLSDELWDLMKRCWKRKPTDRIDISVVVHKLGEIRGLWKGRSSSLIPPSPTSPSISHSILSPLLRHNTKTPPSSPSFGRNISALTHAIKEEPHPSFPNITHDPVHSSPSPLRQYVSLPEDDGTYLPQRRLSRQQSNYSSPQPELERMSLSSLAEVSHSLPKQFGSHMPDFGLGLFDTNSPRHSTSSSHHELNEIGPRFSVSGAYSFGSDHTPSQESGSLLQCAGNSKNVVVSDPEGRFIKSGTIEGLIDKLINCTNFRHDTEFREVFLSTFVDYIAPSELFSVLSRRFHEAEKGDWHSAQKRTELQYNIFRTMSWWVDNPRIAVDMGVLQIMKEFCLTALSIKRSSVMNDKAKEILYLIDRKILTIQAASMQNVQIFPEMLREEMSPRNLAIALTLLEGDTYEYILPTDYLLHLRHKSVATIESARNINNQINIWVKKSILRSEKTSSRTAALTFFINTAEECRQLRNFSSMTAIASALQSPCIDRLQHTKKNLLHPIKVLMDQIIDILDPSSNHRAYRAVLNNVSDNVNRDICIPWTAVHLKELYAVLKKQPSTVTVDGQKLINFERYSRFIDRVKEVLHYSPPNLEKYRPHGQLQYLENRLRQISVGDSAEQALMTRSETLEAREDEEYRTRARELQSLGFRMRSR